MASASLSSLFPLNIHFNGSAECTFTNFTSSPQWIIDLEDFVSLRLIPILFALGLIPNAAFLFTLYHVKSAHTTLNVYLANLAISDVLQLVSTTSLMLANHYDIVSNQIHTLLVALHRGFEVSSNVFVLMIAVERYYAICHPMKHRRLSSRRRTAKLIAGVWLLAAAMWIIIMVTGGTWNDFKIQCNKKYLVSKLVITGSVFSALLAIIIITVTLYALILRRVRRQRHNRSAARHMRQRRVLPMVLVNTAVFFLLNAAMLTTQGLISIYIASELSQRRLAVTEFIEEKAYMIRNAWYIILVIEDVMIMINSLIDPIIYSCTSKEYRANFKEAFAIFKGNLALKSPCKQNSNRNADKTSIATIQTANTNQSTGKNGCPSPDIQFSCNRI